MTIASSFPKELLEQSAAERLNYFRAYTVAHPKLVEAFQAASSALEDASPGTVIFINGPTGAGKTTLKFKMEREIINSMKSELDIDAGRLPVVGITAISSETGSFNWKDFYRRLLFLLNEPCVDKKVNLLVPSNENNKLIGVTTGSRAGVGELRYAVEQILKLRRPVAVLIDDAQHMSKMSSGRRMQDQLDCIKSLADVTGLPIVLFGTYELISFRNLSAQLSRRSTDISLWRYRLSIKEDMQAFKNVLWSFQKHLPLEEEPNLVSEWDFFYERSIGCIGILKDWLSRALAKSLKGSGRQAIRREHFESTSLSVLQCQKMLSEAQEGETILTSTTGSRTLLRESLGLSSKILNKNLKLSSNDNQVQKEAKEHIVEDSKNKKGFQKQRNAKRDFINKKGESDN